jgi:hypothetical protein
VQQGQRRTLSDSEVAEHLHARIAARMAKEQEAASTDAAEKGSGE